MKLELQKIEWADGEAYEVRATPIDNGPMGVIGHLWRFADGGETWRYAVGDFDPNAQGASTIAAATVADARAHLMKRTRFLEVPSDRLTNETTTELVSNTLSALYTLAKDTNSLPGYVASLSGAAAYVCVREFKDAAHADFLDMFITDLRKHVARLTNTKQAADGFAAILVGMLKAAEASVNDADDNKPPIAH